MPSLGRRTTGPEFRQTVQENLLTAAHSAATLSAFLLNSFASGECLAQLRLPTRAELLRGFGVRHDEIESVEGTRHDQEFGCDSRGRAGVRTPCLLRRTGREHRHRSRPATVATRATSLLERRAASSRQDDWHLHSTESGQWRAALGGNCRFGRRVGGR